MQAPGGRGWIKPAGTPAGFHMEPWIYTVTVRVVVPSMGTGM